MLFKIEPSQYKKKKWKLQYKTSLTDTTLELDLNQLGLISSHFINR